MLWLLWHMCVFLVACGTTDAGNARAYDTDELSTSVGVDRTSVGTRRLDALDQHDQLRHEMRMDSYRYV